MSAKNISTLITQIFADQYSEAHQNLETILQEKVKAKVKETLKKIKGKDKDKKKDDKKDGKKKFDPKTFFKKKKMVKESDDVTRPPRATPEDAIRRSIVDINHARKIGNIEALNAAKAQLTAFMQRIKRDPRQDPEVLDALSE